MTLPVARRVQRVKPSPTLAVTARAARLREQGKDVIGLGAGEPDFDTPAHIAKAGVDAIQGGFTRYTNVDGIDELKDAIIAKFGRDNGLTYERSQILVSAGAKQVLYNLAMALIDPGDEVIIPAPYWVSYPDMVLLADGLPVTPFAGMAQGYKITPRQLAAAITPQTRLLLLNSPCNPTGAAYTHAELRGLGEVLLEHPRILIGTDDMYVQGVRHDRLAARLLRRAEGDHRRDEHHPGTVDLECIQHFAEGRHGGAQRGSDLRYPDDRGVQEAP